MARRDETLLAEIERNLLDGKPLADLLRKCIMLGGRSGSVELRDWASRELRGYTPADELPAYRTVGAPIMADATTGHAIIKGQRMPLSGFPDFVQENISEEFPLRQGVGELEALIKDRDPEQGIHFSIPMAADIARLIDQKSGNPYQHINALYWSVVPAVIHGVIDNIRTTLTELISELLGTMPEDQAIPTPDQAHQAVQVAVYGRKSQVRVTTSQASDGSISSISEETQSPTEEKSGFWTRSRKIGAAVVGLAAIVSAVIAMIEYVHLSQHGHMAVGSPDLDGASSYGVVCTGPSAWRRASRASTVSVRHSPA
jgi:hypothetical protein